MTRMIVTNFTGVKGKFRYIATKGPSEGNFLSSLKMFMELSEVSKMLQCWKTKVTCYERYVPAVCH